MTVSLDWENLGFNYMKLPYRFLAHYRNGAWEKGGLTEDDLAYLRIVSKFALWPTSL